MNKDGFFCCTESDGSIPVKKKAGYAYAPFQRLGKLYDPETAMRAGTVFPELNITLDEYERGLYNGVEYAVKSFSAVKTAVRRRLLCTGLKAVPRHPPGR